MELKQLGERLRELRHESGKTLEQVSEKTGITRFHLSAIETGKRSISYDKLNELFNYYGYELKVVIQRL
jgi:transcriptional regulator with XRE-family HTH domain